MIIRIILLSALLLTCIVNIQAVWVDNEPFQYSQPDNIVIDYFVTGDEFYRWGHDEDGFTMIEDSKTGYLCWAELAKDELVSTGIPVHLKDPHLLGLEPYTNISEQAYLDRVDSWGNLNNSVNNAPSTGVIENLVVFVRFADDTGNFNKPVSTFNTRFNSTTTHSLKRYFY